MDDPVVRSLDRSTGRRRSKSRHFDVVAELLVLAILDHVLQEILPEDIGSDRFDLSGRQVFSGGQADLILLVKARLTNQDF